MNTESISNYSHNRTINTHYVHIPHIPNISKINASEISVDSVTIPKLIEISLSKLSVFKNWMSGIGITTNTNTNYGKTNIDLSKIINITNTVMDEYINFVPTKISKNINIFNTIDTSGSFYPLSRYPSNNPIIPKTFTPSHMNISTNSKPITVTNIKISSYILLYRTMMIVGGVSIVGIIFWETICKNKKYKYRPSYIISSINENLSRIFYTISNKLSAVSGFTFMIDLNETIQNTNIMRNMYRLCTSVRYIISKCVDNIQSYDNNTKSIQIYFISALILAFAGFGSYKLLSNQNVYLPTNSWYFWRY